MSDRTSPQPPGWHTATQNIRRLDARIDRCVALLVLNIAATVALCAIQIAMNLW